MASIHNLHFSLPGLGLGGLGIEDNLHCSLPGWSLHVSMLCMNVQMREAVRNSFLLDSHNFGTNKDEMTDTDTVSMMQQIVRTSK